MRRKSSGFYADSLEMLLDTMCNVLGGVVFLTLVLAQLVHNTPPAPPEYYEAQSAALSNQLASVSESEAALEADLQATLERLQEARHQTQTNHVRLPRAGTTTKTPWDVIVRYGRLYPVRLLTTGSAGGIIANARAIERQSTRARGQVNLQPKPDQGEEPESGVARMVQIFRASGRTNYYFTFYVYEDSFRAFNRAEQTVADLGFQYGWEPLPGNTLLQEGGSSLRIPPQN